MNQTVDYLVVGKGLAGSILAMKLLESNCKIHVIDNPAGTSSSKVSAGIFNPITGKRFVKTWLADEIFNDLLDYYQNLENKFEVKLLHNNQIIRPIESIKDQNHLIAFCAQKENEKYIEFLNESNEVSVSINDTKFGLLGTKIGGWVNVNLLLASINNYLIKQSIYKSQIFDYEQIEFKDNVVIYGGIQYKKIIFCEGYNTINNPYFNWLPFNAVKGEVLTIEANIPLANFIILKGIFIVPLGNRKFRVGATYNWEDKTTEITDAGKNELIKKLEKLIGPNFKIVNQTAGIRPATIDRRPFLGLHPKHKSLAILNGLGTKGVSLAPYFVNEMVSFLEKNKTLNPEININRFSSLYLEDNF